MSLIAINPMPPPPHVSILATHAPLPQCVTGVQFSLQAGMRQPIKLSALLSGRHLSAPGSINAVYLN